MAPIEIPPHSTILPRDCRRIKVVVVQPYLEAMATLPSITRQYDVCALAYNGVLLISGPVDQVNELAPKLGNVVNTLYEGCDDDGSHDLCINIYTIT